MKIIDYYLLRRFIITLFFALAAFVTVIVCVDMVGNLGNFIDKEVPTPVIVRYYLLYVPYVVSTLGLPMAMLLASMFSVGQLAKYNELIAIKCAGVSSYRLFASIFLFALFVSIFALVFAEKVVPVTNQHKTQIEEDYLEPHKKRTVKTIYNILVRDARDRRVFIARYHAGTQRAERITVQAYEGNQIVQRIDVRAMRWRDDHWVLEDGYRRSFTDGTEYAVPFRDEIEPDFDFTPETLLESQAEPEDMSYTQLQAFIADVVRNGGDPRKWQVDLNFKLSLPLANFILVLFGAPLASNKQRSGAIFGLILSGLIFLVYFGLTKFVQTLGELGTLEPVIAAWSTNAAFLISGAGVLFWTSR